MLTEKPLGQESELKMQRKRFSKSRTIWRMLKLDNWRPENMKRHLRRCWLLSETVWVMLEVPTIGRMGKMRMMKRLSRASSVKMKNPAGWWAQSRKRYRSAGRGFGKSRWSSMNWLNRDGRMQLTTSVNQRRSTANSNWGFLPSFSRKQMMTCWHLHRQHLESLWRVSTLSPEYRKGQKGLFYQEVVMSGYVRWIRSQNRAYQAVSQLPSLIRQHCWKRRQLNQ